VVFGPLLGPCSGRLTGKQEVIPGGSIPYFRVELSVDTNVVAIADEGAFDERIDLKRLGDFRCRQF
jgi:hypothetical protein